MSGGLGEQSNPSDPGDANSTFSDHPDRQTLRRSPAPGSGADMPTGPLNRDQATELQVKVEWRAENYEIEAERTTTIHDLAFKICDRIDVDPEHMTIWILPKFKKLKYPFPETRLEAVIDTTTRFKVVGVTRSELAHSTEPRRGLSTEATQGGEGRIKAAVPARTRNWKQAQEESQYTFHAIQPLPYLPNPEKSQRFLERLANDPGIKASMRKHKFSVGLLTEMNPAEHTTHESRTLGLNRNRGEVIELRLRTDRYDGYRDYKVIRKTLCHELSHNVWGEHDRNFWDLTKQIEQEVEQNDWKHGGHRISSEEFYNPNDDGAGAEHADAGGWTGGDFVLGGAKNDGEGLTRREIMARAAMSRMEKQEKKDPK